MQSYFHVSYIYDHEKNNLVGNELKRKIDDDEKKNNSFDNKVTGLGLKTSVLR